MRTFVAEIKWPDGRSVRGVARYRALEQGSPVNWEGDAGMIAKLPPDIAGQRCTSIHLLAAGKRFAQREGAHFHLDSSGFYEMTL